MQKQKKIKTKKNYLTVELTQNQLKRLDIYFIIFYALID